MIAASRYPARLWRRRVPAQRAIRAASLVMAAGLVLSWTGAASAQEGPVVIGGSPQRKFRFLDFERPEVILGFVSQYSSNSISGNGTSGSATNRIFQEDIELRTRGYLVSPKFFDMDLYGLFGLQQTKTTGDGIGESGNDSGNDTGDGTVYQYDLSGTLRKESTLPVTAYARRTQQLVNRTFGATLETIYSSYGVDASYLSSTLPSMFRIYHEDTTQSALTGQQDFATNLDAIQWHTEWRPANNQSLSLDYRFNRFDQTDSATPESGPGTSESYDTQEANVEHKVLFGNARASDLTSTFNYMNQSGTISQERIELNERLHLQHNRTFETNYFYRYFDYTFEQSEQAQNEVRGNFAYHLFQSFTATGNVGARFLDLNHGEGKTDEQYADLSLAYNKKIPLGVLNLNARAGLSRQQNDARANPVEVVDEQHTFSNYQPVVITQPFIDANSIRITSANGLFTYRKNVDYVVRTFPDRVEIRPQAGGLLGPTASTLIDYTLNPQPGNDADTNVFGFGARYDFTEGAFKGLGAYASYLMQDQTITSDQPGLFTPDDIRDLTVGANYRVWKFLFTAEYRDHDSTVSPYSETRLEGQFLHRTGSGTNISLDARYQMDNYSGDVSDAINILTLSGSLDQNFSRDLHGSLTASYLQMDGSTQDTTRGTDVELKLDWKHRQTEIYGIIRHSTLNTTDADSSFLIFQMGIKRTF